MSRLEVRKTLKLYIGGAFPRSESGRSYPIHAAARDGSPTPVVAANAAAASRKDARAAVVAARAAGPGWAGATAYNRGQILYRVAEVMEARRDQFIAEIRLSEGGTPARARAQAEAAIDQWVWYAGWADKLVQVLGSPNPVAAPFLNVSVPEPVGVVAALAPSSSSLLGLVSCIAPTIVSGNTCVVHASEDRPIPAISLAECLATSDVPGGVVNILTGRVADTMPTLAAHRDVDGLDLTGATDARGVTLAELEIAAADNLKRLRRPGPEAGPPTRAGSADPGLAGMRAFLDVKTTWHPRGQ